MATFVELLEKSVVTQFLITSVSVTTLCALFLLGKPVPPELLSLNMVIVGFYFGNKNANQSLQTANKALELAKTGPLKPRGDT